jgi:hypothetical protein
MDEDPVAKALALAAAAVARAEAKLDKAYLELAASAEPDCHCVMVGHRVVHTCSGPKRLGNLARRTPQPARLWSMQTWVDSEGRMHYPYRGPNRPK